MQRPLVQGTLLQQSLLVVQVWPYSAHVPPSGMVASTGGGPASTDGGRPQTPRVEPGGNVQGSPVQQSAAVVQPPPLPTQSPPHTKGGTPPSSVKPGLGTHANPQQSALLAQGCPALDPASSHGLPVIVQRGMPRLSCWQTNGF